MKVPAVIICGGLGTRLRGILGDRPKCLAPIGGRTFLDLFTSYLHRQGVEHFIFATGYGHEHVKAWLRSERRKWRWTLSREHKPLGTGGALRLAAQHISSNCLLAFNGDTFLEIDCVALLARHSESSSPLTLAAVEVADTSAFGRLELSDGRVRGFHEKGIRGPGVINGGAYAVDRDFLCSQPTGHLSLEKDILMRPGFQPSVLVTCGRFLDIGTPEQLAAAEEMAGALR